MKTMAEKVKFFQRKYSRLTHDIMCSRLRFEIFPKMRLRCKCFLLNFSRMVTIILQNNANWGFCN